MSEGEGLSSCSQPKTVWHGNGSPMNAPRGSQANIAHVSRASMFMMGMDNGVFPSTGDQPSVHREGDSPAMINATVVPSRLDLAATLGAP